MRMRCIVEMEDFAVESLAPFMGLSGTAAHAALREGPAADLWQQSGAPDMYVAVSQACTAVGQILEVQGVDADPFYTAVENLLDGLDDAISRAFAGYFQSNKNGAVGDYAKEWLDFADGFPDSIKALFPSGLPDDVAQQIEDAAVPFYDAIAGRAENMAAVLSTAKTEVARTPDDLDNFVNAVASLCSDYLDEVLACVLNANYPDAGTTEGAVADTIRDQLGGKALYMIGAKNLMADKNTLQFKFMKNKTGGNLMRITLNGADTYDIQVLGGSAGAMKVKAEEKGIHVDALAKTIEKMTGLALSLGNMGKTTNEGTLVEMNVAARANYNAQRAAHPVKVTMTPAEREALAQREAAQRKREAEAAQKKREEEAKQREAAAKRGAVSKFVHKVAHKIAPKVFHEGAVDEAVSAGESSAITAFLKGEKYANAAAAATGSELWTVKAGGAKDMLVATREDGKITVVIGNYSNPRTAAERLAKEVKKQAKAATDLTVEEGAINEAVKFPAPSTDPAPKTADGVPIRVGETYYSAVAYKGSDTVTVQKFKVAAIVSSYTVADETRLQTPVAKLYSSKDAADKAAETKVTPATKASFNKAYQAATAAETILRAKDVPADLFKGAGVGDVDGRAFLSTFTAFVEKVATAQAKVTGDTRPQAMVALFTSKAANASDAKTVKTVKVGDYRLNVPEEDAALYRAYITGAKALGEAVQADFGTTASNPILEDAMSTPAPKTNEAELSADDRAKLKDSDFAIPDKREYPIHDLAHAKDALSRVSANGTAAEKKQVRAAVYKKYPDLQPADEAAPTKHTGPYAHGSPEHSLIHAHNSNMRTYKATGDKRYLEAAKAQKEKAKTMKIPAKHLHESDLSDMLDDYEDDDLRVWQSADGSEIFFSVGDWSDNAEDIAAELADLYPDADIDFDYEAGPGAGDWEELEEAVGEIKIPGTNPALWFSVISDSDYVFDGILMQSAGDKKAKEVGRGFGTKVNGAYKARIRQGKVEDARAAKVVGADFQSMKDAKASLVAYVKKNAADFAVNEATLTFDEVRAAYRRAVEEAADTKDLPFPAGKSWGDLSKAETAKVVDAMAKWPLAKLRKHQAIANQQIKAAHSAGNTKALENEQAHEEIVTAAIDQNQFGEGATTDTDGTVVLSESVRLTVPQFKAAVEARLTKAIAESRAHDKPALNRAIDRLEAAGLAEAEVAALRTKMAGIKDGHRALVESRKSGTMSGTSPNKDNVMNLAEAAKKFPKGQLVILESGETAVVESVEASNDGVLLVVVDEAKKDAPKKVPAKGVKAKDAKADDDEDDTEDNTDEASKTLGEKYGLTEATTADELADVMRALVRESVDLTKVPLVMLRNLDEAIKDGSGLKFEAAMDAVADQLGLAPDVVESIRRMSRAAIMQRIRNRIRNSANAGARARNRLRRKEYRRNSGARRHAALYARKYKPRPGSFAEGVEYRNDAFLAFETSKEDVADVKSMVEALGFDGAVEVKEADGKTFMELPEDVLAIVEAVYGAETDEEAETIVKSVLA